MYVTNIYSIASSTVSQFSAKQNYYWKSSVFTDEHELPPSLHCLSELNYCFLCIFVPYHHFYYYYYYCVHRAYNINLCLARASLIALPCSMLYARSVGRPNVRNNS